MSIEITARHIHITQGFQGEARAQAQELVDLFPRIEHIHVILDLENRDYVAEVVVRAKNHIHVEATETGPHMKAVLDTAMEKAERQLRKLRDKVQDHHAAMKHEELVRQKGVPVEEEDSL